MSLTRHVSTVGEDIHPACFPDLNGQVFLRGHVTLAPVPAVGGALLVLLPLDKQGTCACTPEDQDVIATTSSIAFPTPTITAAEVCLIRVIIQKIVTPDVNEDGIIDLLDITQVEMSPYYNIIPNASYTKCVDPPGSPPGEGTPVECGRVDVNRDGRVDQLDSTSITQSAWLGTNVTCGGIYATHFSCGSERKAPILPAMGISFDTISYFSDDGLILNGQDLGHRWADYVQFQGGAPGYPLLRRSTHSTALMDSMLEEFEHMQHALAKQDVEFKSKLKQLEMQDQSIWNSIKSIGAPNTLSNSHTLIDIFMTVALVCVSALIMLIVFKRKSTQ